ncbi:MAG: hypothetical protein WC755_07040 [Candidatus Woesearchaeota archaeon]|jgi:hypothetical protein
MKGDPKQTSNGLKVGDIVKAENLGYKHLDYKIAKITRIWKESKKYKTTLINVKWLNAKTMIKNPNDTWDDETHWIPRYFTKIQSPTFKELLE